MNDFHSERRIMLCTKAAGSGSMFSFVCLMFHSQLDLHEAVVFGVDCYYEKKLCKIYIRLSFSSIQNNLYMVWWKLLHLCMQFCQRHSSCPDHVVQLTVFGTNICI